MFLFRTFALLTRYSLFGVGDNDAENVRDVLEVGHHVVDIDAGGGAQTRDHGVEPAIELH